MIALADWNELIHYRLLYDYWTVCMYWPVSQVVNHLNYLHRHQNDIKSVLILKNRRGMVTVCRGLSYFIQELDIV